MKHCRACSGELFDQPLLTLDHMPASAQDIPDADGIKDDQGITLSLCQCRSCGLVQFDCEPVAYYREVIRAGGFSTTMVELRRQQYRHLIDTYQLAGKRFLEVGCGQGEFLSVLAEFPVKAYGIEYKDSLVKLAGERGLKVRKDFAGSPGQQLLGAPYDVFLSFNFLEHQPDPSAMLQVIYDNLAEDGMGLLTVPSFEYILEQDGYYEFIRDHLAYYTFDSLAMLLNQNGFEVLEQEMVNRDTISVIVRKVPVLKRQALYRKNSPLRVPVKKLDVSGLLASRDRIDREVNACLEAFAKNNQTVAVWGASHQGFTLAATTGLGEKVRYIIDSAPFKQGLFAPASHLPIVAPEHFYTDPVDAVLIVAPGYTEEIAGIIRQRFAGPDRPVTILTLRSDRLEYL